MAFTLSKDMPVHESFDKLIAALNPTEKQRERIQATRQSIDSLLANDPRIHLYSNRQVSFFTGSYSRHTILRPIDDIDLYVKIHYGKHAEYESPLPLLRLIASALRTRYPNTKIIRVDAPCVVIQFEDYKFEIVPAYGYSDVPGLYGIPGPQATEWVGCYPHVPNEWLSSSNSFNNGKFIPLIKIIKQWNRYHKVGLKSFHIELLTERVFNNIEVRSYPEAVLDWFACVQKWIVSSDHSFISEPGKWYPFVDKYIYDNPFKLRLIRRKLRQGLNRAEMAWTHYLRGNINAAKLYWYSLFGSMFPVPTSSHRVAPRVQPSFPPNYQQPFLFPYYPGIGLLDMHSNNLLGRQDQSHVDLQSDLIRCLTNLLAGH